MDSDSRAYRAEILDVVLGVRHQPDGNIEVAFIDGAGQKVILHLGATAARELRDELIDLDEELP